MSGGIFNVGSYQVAGHPYVTGNVINANQQHGFFFPSVTKRIKVQVYDPSGAQEDIRIHFVPLQNNNVITGSHWWHVGAANNLLYDLDVEVKTDRIFISHQEGTNVKYQIFAELTNISAKEMYPLTGSGISL